MKQLTKNFIAAVSGLFLMAFPQLSVAENDESTAASCAFSPLSAWTSCGKTTKARPDKVASKFFDNSFILKPV